MARDEGKHALLTRVSDIATLHGKEPSSTQENHEATFEPICGFDKMPLVTLEEAVQPLIAILPQVQHFATKAKKSCQKLPTDRLTHDQSASILLYTMEWAPREECLYRALNATLRSGDRKQLTPWFSYLKLFITALKRLPSVQQVVFRGVNGDLTKDYPTGKTVTWWNFSSCTRKIDVLQNDAFLAKQGERTMFTIFCNAGKDISRYSDYRDEAEVLLLPGRQFIIESCLNPAHGLNMVQLKETEPHIELLEGVQFIPSTVPLVMY